MQTFKGKDISDKEFYFFNLINHKKTQPNDMMINTKHFYNC